MSTFDPMVIYHPTPKKKGNVKIEPFNIPSGMAGAMKLASTLNEEPEEWTEAGTYVRLEIDGRTWMSDARMERITNQRFVDRAKGDVLIAGLGIGLILPPLQRKRDVRSITVLEANPDVATLVAPRFKKLDKLSVVIADVYQFEPTTSYDTIYFDIWPDRCPENLPDMRKLHNKYRPFLKPEGFMESWYRQEILGRMRVRREDRRFAKAAGFGNCFVVSGIGELKRLLAEAAEELERRENETKFDGV